MKYFLLLLACLASVSLYAQQFADSKKATFNSLEIEKPNGSLGKYAPEQDSIFLSKLLKRVKVGALLHFVGVGLQDRPTALEEAAPDFNRNWDKQFNVYRARILVGVELTKKTNFFMETEIPSIIGRGDNSSGKTIQVNPVILDAQVEHTFADEFSLIAGLQLVGVTRNQLQSAAASTSRRFWLLPISIQPF